MKPTDHAGRRLLTAADAARIRELLIESRKIKARLKEITEREIASYINPQIPSLKAPALKLKRPTG
jgi:hypothetical protein